MPEVRCPVCNTPNTENQENCLVCGARLRVATEPLPPIRAGQEPTAKSTGELERTLPGWLRDLRSGGSEQSSTSTEPAQPAAEPTQEQQNAKDDLLAGLLSDTLFEEPSTESTPESPTDFLSGLMSAAGDEEEEAPDWLKSLQSDLPSQPVIETPPSDVTAPADNLGALDWFASSEEETALAFETDAQPPALTEETSEEVADWLRTLDTQAPAAPVQHAPTPARPSESPAGGDEAPDWLAELGSEALPFEFVEPSATPGQSQPAVDLSDWFATAEETPAEPL
ncbi:MAG: hypothetical protein WHV44_12845, partial [Anaerolineales bacterium]